MPDKRENMPSPAGSRVTATAKALRVLDCFSPTQPELSLAQISRILNMPKSTLLNQLRTLEEAGFLGHSQENQTYRLGHKIMELSYCAHAAMPVIQYAVPVTREPAGDGIFSRLSGMEQRSFSSNSNTVRHTGESGQNTDTVIQLLYYRAFVGMSTGNKKLV